MNNDGYKRFRIMINCPVCDKKALSYESMLKHLSCSKEEKHLDFIRNSQRQYVDIYLKSVAKTFYDELAKEGNIYAGMSFTHSHKILKKFLTQQTIEQNRRIRISNTSKMYIKTNEHKIALSKSVKKAWQEGKYDTEECKEAKNKGYKKRPSMKGKNNPMFGKPSPKNSGHGKGGFRPDLGHYVRSTWEANICRILKLCNIKYIYEPKRFFYGNHSYCPDLFLENKNKYVEIKGHAKSERDWKCVCDSCVKTKHGVEEIRKQDFKVYIIGSNEYRRLSNKYKSKIDLWEKS